MTRPSSQSFLTDLFGLEGQTAVVVGGTGVLCGAMARGFLGAGCRVVLVGREPGPRPEAHFMADWEERTG